MALLVFFFSFLLTVLPGQVVSHPRSGQPPEFQCIEDGLFADYYRACYVYYNCQQGIKETFGCPVTEQGEMMCFSMAAKACISCDIVHCPRPELPPMSRRIEESVNVDSSYKNRGT